MKTVYGRTNYYVQGEEAKFVRQLTGKKTVDKADIEALKSLGIEVTVQHEPIKY